MEQEITINKRMNPFQGRTTSEEILDQGNPTYLGIKIHFLFIIFHVKYSNIKKVISRPMRRMILLEVATIIRFQGINIWEIKSEVTTVDPMNHFYLGSI